jgi:small-conductance mechanosensitive channel
MTLDSFYTQLEQWLLTALHYLTSPTFYAQIACLVLALIVAISLARGIKSATPLLHTAPEPGRLLALRKTLYEIRDLLFPLLLILILTPAVDIAQQMISRNWLVKAGLSFAVIYLLFSVITRFVHKSLFRKMAYWILLPLAVLHIFGWLDDVSLYMQSISFHLGNISISLYGIARVVIFGSVLFWLGRISNHAGQEIIRNQEDLDLGTREVFVKLFQVILYLVLFLLLLQLMGINLTALAVFGGALGVGLGFGLQSIASNFISGIILLLDRSLAVGDYIEMEDGRAGTIRALNMRSTTLETYDGKDIMVPNEQFITTSFTNWTHKNTKQRYALEFDVAYDTDLHSLFSLIREVVASHPQVLSGDAVPIEERPDAEIKEFGNSGIVILVEYWIDGVDDGVNRVGADLNLMIWDALKERGVVIPFPQREVRILNQ